MDDFALLHQLRVCFENLGLQSSPIPDVNADEGEKHGRLNPQTSGNDLRDVSACLQPELPCLFADFGQSLGGRQ